MKYLRNQNQNADISSYAPSSPWKHSAICFSELLQHSPGSSPLYPILYPEAHGHPSALLLQGDLVWSSGTSSLERARSVFREFLSLVCSSSRSILPLLSLSAPIPGTLSLCGAPRISHAPVSRAVISFCLLHILPSNSLNYDSKSQMLLFISLPIKILLNLQDPPQSLSP